MKYERTNKARTKEVNAYNEKVHSMTKGERLKAGMGKYEPRMLDEVKRLSRFGCSIGEIADFYGITQSIFEGYLRELPELYSAVEEGRMIDSMKVVDSLHKQALGYTVKEYEVAEHMTKDGQIIKLKKKTTKHILPNVTAAIYLLKTRHGDKWMDIIKNEQTKNLNITVKNVDFSDISDEDLLALKKIGVKRIPNEFGVKPQKMKIINQENNPNIQDV